MQITVFLNLYVMSHESWARKPAFGKVFEFDIVFSCLFGYSHQQEH